MIVVTGATGNVGRSLLKTLARTTAVTAVSRGQLPVDLPEGVRYQQADLAQPESLRPAVAGAHTLFLLVAGAGAHLDVHQILKVSQAGGIERVVLLSSQAAGTRPQSVSHAPLREIERAAENSGLAWTILRPGGFASNAYAWAESVRAHRTVAAPFGDVGLPLIDPDDIADVAATVLQDDAHSGHLYELTGPALSTPRQRAADLAAALAEPIHFVGQTRDEARAQMLQFMPEPVVDGTLSILGEPTPAEQRISPQVQQLLGRPPRTFAHWIERHVDAFR
ncbi:NAD(P)H-binding protein [Micromonospora sp. NPDC048909]|uniref:NAD(P)H-binding protein n=1 Tax=Micromonospora sp. NPDC048909 TaxID=3155643 RepID=UPI0033C3BB65